MGNPRQRLARSSGKAVNPALEARWVAGRVALPGGPEHTGPNDERPRLAGSHRTGGLLCQRP